MNITKKTVGDLKLNEDIIIDVSGESGGGDSRHTVTFSVSDSVYKTAKVFDGDPVSCPDDPASTSKETGEWYVTESSFDHWEVDGVEYDFTSPVTKDITITAVLTDHPAVIIKTLDELVAFQKSYKEAAIAKTVPENLIVKLDADIDMTGVKWDSIGLVNGSTNNPSYAFTSTFDGQGHKITNLTLSDLSEGGTIGDINNYRGFFGLVTDGVIRNLTVSGNGFGDTVPSGEYGCALLIGRTTTLLPSDAEYGYDNIPSPVIVENCVSEGTVTGTHNTAGLVVQACVGTFRNCVNKATVIGKYTKVGGLIAFAQGQQGYTINMKFLDCVNEGTVTATDNTSKGGRDGVGGIIGYLNYGLVWTDGLVNKGVVSRTDTALSTAPVGQIIGNMSNYTTNSGVTKVLPMIKTVGVYQTKTSTSGGIYPAYWDFANPTIDSEGLVSLVDNKDVVPGKEYRAVMTSRSEYKLTTQNVPLLVDERLCDANIVSGVDGYSVEKTQNGTMTTYKLVKNA